MNVIQDSLPKYIRVVDGIPTITLTEHESVLEQCIKQAKREALMEASNKGWWDTDVKMILRRMAEEIKI